LQFRPLNKKVTISPLNFTKRGKAAEKMPPVSKQGDKIASFCKDKRPKYIISLIRGAKEHISLKLEGQQSIFP